MKNISFPRIFANLIFAAISTMAINACTTDTAEFVESKHAETISKQDKDAIESMGFDTADIIETQDHYIVEGDIMLSKKAVTEQKENAQTRQSYYGINHIVNTNMYPTLRIAVDLRYPDRNFAMQRYYDVLKSVVDEWNGIENIKLKFANVTTSQNPHIVVRPMAMLDSNAWYHTQLMCIADISQSGHPGQNIYINTEAYDKSVFGTVWTKVTNEKVKTSLTHAIGHCIGLAHTDKYSSDPNSIENTPSELIPGTNRDGASIMNSWKTECYQTSWGEGINYMDRLAVQAMYSSLNPPNLNISITGPSYAGVNGSMTYTVNLGNTSLPASDFSFEWKAPGAIFSGSSTSQFARIHYSSMGNKSISVTVTYKPLPLELYTASKTFTIGEDPIKNMSCEYPDKIFSGNAYPFTATYTDNRPDKSKPVTYSWHVDNSVITDKYEKTAQITFNSLGIQIVRMGIYYDGVGYGKDIICYVYQRETPITNVSCECPNQGFVGNSYPFTATYTDNRPDDSKPITYSWYVDNSVITDKYEKTAQITFNSPGLNIVRMGIYYDGVGYGKDVMSCYVWPLPFINQPVAIGNNQYKIELSQTAANATYNWFVSGTAKIISNSNTSIIVEPVGGATYAKIAVRGVLNGNDYSKEVTNNVFF